MIQTKNIILLISILFISACGYQLRGKIDLPEELKSLYLQGGSKELRKVLRKTLKSSGGNLVTEIRQAGMIVNVEKDKMEKRVLSLSSTGRASEYEIIYRLEFNLLDNEGKVLSTKQKIELSKEYFNDQEEILGKDNEELVIREELYRNAVRSMVDRSRVAIENIKQ